jgi:hypothetical protein
MAHRNLVRSFVELGRLDEATVELDAASALAKTETDRTSVLLLRGELARRQGRTAEALADHVLVEKRTASAEPARRIEPLVALAESSLAAGRIADALERANEAAVLAERTYGASSCRLASPLRIEAEARIAAGRENEALVGAERAALLLRDAQIDPLVVARSNLALAQALPVTEGERARGLARSARDVAAADGRDPKLVASIDRWLTSAH